ncbi:hypothetical protein DEO72_LG10g1239 [Vigna unguiculata]|uniref:Uncharacterized protein n=1 Tax=Vigna unguiculata TaxID=3917 RepID=A0A4D6N8D1_VIGUN|nr:hypothetical protein DEO72_LG10g1239 [Vigna unguiculata]
MRERHPYQELPLPPTKVVAKAIVGTGNVTSVFDAFHLLLHVRVGQLLPCTTSLHATIVLRRTMAVAPRHYYQRQHRQRHFLRVWGFPLHLLLQIGEERRRILGQLDMALCIGTN